MKIDKEFILKNLITICCAASILLLFLPFCSVTVGVSILGESSSSGAAVSGFDVVAGKAAVVWGWVMVICPALLVAMNYIKQLDKYKSILAIVLPIVSLISAIIAMFTAGSASAKATGMGSSVEVSVMPHVGFFLLVVAYIGTLVAGAMTFHGLKLSKEGIAEFRDKLKEEGVPGMDALKGLGDKAGQTFANMKNHTASENAPAQGENTTASAAAPQKVAKKTDMNNADRVLGLINQLNEMKQQGILTDEEFSEKKKELLAQI